MTQFTKSFLWRFILDVILLGIFVRILQSVILAVLSRFMETYSTPFLIIEAVVVSAISMLFICLITYWNIGATSKIRKMSDPEKANIPIIAMTANAFAEDRKRALDVGMNDHVAKPIDMNVLIPTLEKYL